MSLHKKVCHPLRLWLPFHKQHKLDAVMQGWSDQAEAMTACKQSMRADQIGLGGPEQSEGCSRAGVPKHKEG